MKAHKNNIMMRIFRIRKYNSLFRNGPLLGLFIFHFVFFSCATIPKEVYINARSFEGLSKFALSINLTPLDVDVSKDGPLFWLPIGFIGWIGGVVESAIRAEIDNSSSRNIENKTDFDSFENQMAESFIALLGRGSFSDNTIELLKDGKKSGRQLLAYGYDALISLSVPKIQIQRDIGNRVRLIIQVHGQMKNLRTGRILWDRSEITINTDSQTLEYYKKNGLHELDSMLEKAITKLAYDFVY